MDILNIFNLSWTAAFTCIVGTYFLADFMMGFIFGIEEDEDDIY